MREQSQSYGSVLKRGVPKQKSYLLKPLRDLIGGMLETR